MRHSNVRCLVVGYIAEGHGYHAIGNYNSAIHSYEKALEISIDPFYSQWARSFVAMGYLLNGQFDKWEKENKEVISYKAGDKNLVGRTYINLGRLNKAKKRTNKAKEYFAKAIKVFETIDAEVFLKQAKDALESLE